MKPITLDGFTVGLEPLSMVHLDSLSRHGLDETLWSVTMTVIRSSEEMRRYIDEALVLQERGSALPFAIVLRRTGEAIGSTRFGNIDSVNRRVEIGWTWIGRQWQGTDVNTEAKYLLLRHAFADLGCIRVEFKTDSINARSRAALLAIGASEEGILRNHMIAPGGRFRHSVYYSIIREEWPEVRKALEERMLRLRAR